MRLSGGRPAGRGGAATAIMGVAAAQRPTGLHSDMRAGPPATRVHACPAAFCLCFMLAGRLTVAWGRRALQQFCEGGRGRGPGRRIPKSGR
jgi:hypothetical protein